MKWNYEKIHSSKRGNRTKGEHRAPEAKSDRHEVYSDEPNSLET